MYSLSSLADSQSRITGIPQRKQKWTLSFGGARAYLGSARYMDKQIGGQVDGIRARRSSGSALKPFVFALGISIGHGLRKMVRDTLLILWPGIRRRILIELFLGHSQPKKL